MNEFKSTSAVQTLSCKGIHAGTHVTRQLLDRLGSPDEKLKIIHIAGTNGKGSTAEFFTRILIAAGKETGTFTSPCVYDYYDQFRINGEIISADKIENYFSVALEAAKGLDATEFEIETAAIIYAFFKEGCEYAVLECGMGGLNDATNAINKKTLAVITSISLEHTAYLGDTIERICGHKAGIIKNCPAVVNPYQPSVCTKEFFKKRGVFIADEPYFTDENSDGCSFCYKGKNYTLSVNAAYQAYNAVTAIEGAKILGLTEAAVSEGLKNTLPRGRTEVFRADGRNYILDGAHNPAAFEPLVMLIRGLPDNDLTVVFGCLRDKDIDGNLSMLAATRAEKIIAVPCPSPRSRTAEDVRNSCLKYYTDVSTAESVSEALDTANTKTVVVCGSFTLLKEAKHWIEKRQ